MSEWPMIKLQNIEKCFKTKAGFTYVLRQIDLEIAEGEFANLAMIAHSSSEFVIDFIRLMPGIPKAKVKSRIVITPEHAKRLLAACRGGICG